MFKKTIEVKFSKFKNENPVYSREHSPMERCGKKKEENRRYFNTSWLEKKKKLYQVGQRTHMICDQNIDFEHNDFEEIIIYWNENAHLSIVNQLMYSTIFSFKDFILQFR